uniref:Uncharacterized protein n=1 Tax=Arundo donax TaxID=35708 RepID=A0A0A8Z4I7_ARUDO
MTEHDAYVAAVSAYYLVISPSPSLSYHQ